jgi:hypothetical protein
VGRFGLCSFGASPSIARVIDAGHTVAGLCRWCDDYGHGLLKRPGFGPAGRLALRGGRGEPVLASRRRSVDDRSDERSTRHRCSDEGDILPARGSDHASATLPVTGALDASLGSVLNKESGAGR